MSQEEDPAIPTDVRLGGPRCSTCVKYVKGKVLPRTGHEDPEVE
jgi:hypothetical protein